MNLDELSSEEVAKLKTLLEKSDKITKPREKKRINLYFIVGGGFILSILLAVGYFFFINPLVLEAQAKNHLAEESNVSAIIVGNNEMLSYQPEIDDLLSGSNPRQLALGVNGEITEPVYFEFKSKNSSNDSHVVDLYIDFYSQQARDFIALNQSTLTNLIGNGRIILRVHPAVQKNGFSIYAPEALAEVFGTNPDKAWNFFIQLMKESDTILSSNSPEDPQASDQEILQFIGGISAEVGIPAGACSSSPCNTVDSDSIKFLTFFSWLYSGADNPNLNVGYYPPIIYINGNLVDHDVYRFSDPKSVSNMFDKLAPRN